MDKSFSTYSDFRKWLLLSKALGSWPQQKLIKRLQKFNLYDDKGMIIESLDANIKEYISLLWREYHGKREQWVVNEIKTEPGTPHVTISKKGATKDWNKQNVSTVEYVAIFCIVGLAIYGLHDIIRKVVTPIVTEIV